MASSKIKGITIEIDGDTTKLGKALESAEGSSKSLQSELKGINTLLKLDPSNVELLTQKQQVLTDAISSTEDKLKTLRNAQGQVQAQFEKGEITVQQYRDFQREIVATEAKLESLKKEAKDFGSVFEQQAKQASESVKELGGKVEEAGKKMGGVSAAAGAGLVASAKSAADNEAAVNKYIASTGKAVSETDKYKNLMETIYKNNYGESIADVADKMRIVSNIMGDLPEAELQRVVEKSYMLEDAYGMDFQENIRGVSALMKQFGITSDEAYELINSGAQNGLNQNQDLTDQIAEYSTYYADLGLNAYDFFGIMTAGAKDGAYQMDYLNDAIKEFGIRTKDGSDGTKDAFKALGLNANELTKQFAKGGTDAQNAFVKVTSALMNVKDEVKRNELGVQLFGTKWEDLGEDAVKAMTSAYDQTEILGKSVEETSETMYGGTSAKAQEAVRSIQTSFASLGETLLPIIAPIAEKIAALAQKFSELSPTIQKIILVVTGIVAAFAPVTIIIGKVITAIGTIIPLLAKLAPIFTKLKTLVSGLFTLIAAHPVVAIVAAIIGLIVLLWNKCEWFRDGVKAIWEAIKTGFSIAYEWLKGVISGIGEFFVNLWTNITTIFSNVATWFDTYLVQPISNAFQAIMNFINQYLIQPLLTLWNSYIYPIISKIIEIIKKVGEIIFSVFKGVAIWIYQNVIQPVIKFVQDLFNKVTKIFTSIWNKIVSVFSKVASWVSNNIISPVVNTVNNLKDKVVKVFTSIWNKITSVFGKVGSWFKDKFQQAYNGITSVFSKIGSFFSGIWSKISSTFSALGTKIGDAIGGAVKSGINRVLTFIENTINKAIGLINGAINVINKLPGVSVSKISKLKLPRLATGTNYVPEDEMPAILHKGEQVVPKKYNPEVNDKHLKNAVFDALTSFTNQKVQSRNTTIYGINELTNLLKVYMPEIIENMGRDLILDGKKVGQTIAPTINKELGYIAQANSRGR